MLEEEEKSSKRKVHLEGKLPNSIFLLDKEPLVMTFSHI